MKHTTKTTPRANHAPINVTTEKWHALDVASQALQTEFAPALQPLSEAERRDLLRVNVVNAAFTADYVTLLNAQPGLVPDLLKPADTLRDWQTCQELLERLPAILRLAQDIEDTIAGLQADCYAAALGTYRTLVRGGLQASTNPAFEPMRAHMARLLDQRRQTRAANLALQAAKDALAAAQQGGGDATPATLAAAIVPMNTAAVPRNGTPPATLTA